MSLFKRSPKNTEQEARENPLIPLVEAMSAGSASGGILAQEARGQRELVESEVLPTEMRPEDRAALEASGVKFGDIVPGDHLFQYVELPEGWRKVATDHSMWSDLVDNKGRKRAGIFYKAAFYDRNARLSCNRRFSVSINYDMLDEGKAVAQVFDQGEIVHTTKSIKLKNSDDYKERQEAQEVVVQEAKDWLGEYYPNWQDASAYWD